MNSYVEKVLIDGEALRYSGHPSLWAYFGKIVLASSFIVGGVVGTAMTARLFMLGLCFVGALLLIVVYINYKSVELAITTKRIIVKFGFIRRDTTEINLSKVESVQVGQSLLGRLLNFGTISVSAGDESMASVPHIHAPLEFRKQFMMATDQRQV